MPWKCIKSNIGNSNGRKRSVGERNKLSRLSQYVRESSLRYNKHFPYRIDEIN
jgi:hypothetical protein